MIAWLLACEAEPVPVVAQAPSGRVMLTVDVVEAGDPIRVMGPQGLVSLALLPGATTAFTPKAGDTVQLDCEVAADGSRRVARVLPHTGLGIYYGEVTAIDAQGVTVTSPLGARRFAVNAWSDMPTALAVGEFVGAKFYAMDGGHAILNVRRFPGAVVDVGRVSEVGPPLVVHTLAGPRRHDVAADVAVGDYVAVGPSGVEPRSAPIVFTGKLSSWDPATRVFAMVDAWGATLGVVNFRLDTCDADCAAIAPGDLVEVGWTLEDGTPTLAWLQERQLSPVFFGPIDAIDATSVTLTTLQRQRKVLRITPETKVPLPVGPGDHVDVVWRGEPPEALLIVKE